MTMIPEAVRLPFTFGLSGALHVAALSGLVLPVPVPSASTSSSPFQVELTRRSQVAGTSFTNLPHSLTAPVLNPHTRKIPHTTKVQPSITRAPTLPRGAFSIVSRAGSHSDGNRIPVVGALPNPAEAITPTLPEVSWSQASIAETSVANSNAAAHNNTADVDAEQSTLSGNQDPVALEPDGTLNSPFKVPKALYAPLRKYPEEARWEGRTGQGSLGFRLKPDGSVDQEIRVLRSSGHADLDATAVESLRRWRFAFPPGAAPSSWYRYPFRFGIS